MRVRRARVLLAGLICAALGMGSSPAVAQAPPSACERTKLAVVVNLDDTKHAGTISHVRRALDSGQPRYLHIDRPGRELRRRASLRGTPTREGFDRDEYPPALAAEGGAGADIAYVTPSDNRSAGSKLGNSLSSYCDGQAFIVEPF